MKLYRIMNSNTGLYLGEYLTSPEKEKVMVSWTDGQTHAWSGSHQKATKVKNIIEQDHQLIGKLFLV